MRKKKIGRIALLVLAVVMGAGVFFACNEKSTTLPVEETESGPKFVAHRGYSHSYVGNTEGAFRAAAGLGFYGIETDIRKAKDGYIVCNHDATVQYADGTEKKIATTSLEELLAQPIKNDKTKENVYLCTFEKYLRACKEGGKVAVIELKDYFSKKEVQNVLEIIDEEYDREKTVFISFSYGALMQVKKADPSIELQYLSQTENDAAFDSCLEDKVSIDVKQTILTEALVKTFHDEGLKVNVWTVNDEDSLEVAERYGVDFITTDVFYED